LNIVSNLDEQERVRTEYGVPRNATIFIYGGNLGKPQGISFLLDILKSNQGKSDRFFFIVGAGTEYENIQTLIENGYNNAKLLKYLPKPDYDKLVATADVGLIFLDKRFTIPNFPSRLLTYMEFSMPVLAATDRVTDIREVIEKNDIGFWCESGDLGRFNQCLDKLCEDKETRVGMGENARTYLLANYTVSKSYDIITKHLTQE
jgi:glycosyltransferase involved in cell wall biosynthesis